MHIRQVSLQYQAEADRLLLRVRSSDDKVFAVWMTRRLCLRPVAAPVGVGATRRRVSGCAACHADAGSCGDARRFGPPADLGTSDFSQPFQATAAQQPLGPEPMLAHVVQLTPQSGGQLKLSISDAQQRNVQLVLDAALGTAVRELMAAALRQADWGLALADAAPGAEPGHACSTDRRPDRPQPERRERQRAGKVRRSGAQCPAGLAAFQGEDDFGRERRERRQAAEHAGDAEQAPQR